MKGNKEPRASCAHSHTHTQTHAYDIPERKAKGYLGIKKSKLTNLALWTGISLNSRGIFTTPYIHSHADMFV